MHDHSARHHAPLLRCFEVDEAPLRATFSNLVIEHGEFELA
ncbi:MULTISPECIES: hypothetical protein [Corynebacterium]|nr:MULTISPECIES: hypothetical protein [Corynebacterium]